jgi:hypothetical protein
MAFQTPGFSFSLPASADLSASQHHFVEVDANGRVTISNAAGESVLGVLQNDPDAIDVAAAIMTNGISKVVAGAAVTVGALVQTNASGRAIAALSADFVVGRALEAAGGNGEVIPVHLGENQRLP